MPTVQLGHGDLLVMEKWTQARVKHAVPKHTGDEHRPRINFTWRWLSTHQATCPRHARSEVPAPPTLAVPTMLSAANAGNASNVDNAGNACNAGNASTVGNAGNDGELKPKHVASLQPASGG